MLYEKYTLYLYNIYFQKMNLLENKWKNSNGYCSICDKTIKRQNNWKKHLNSKKHLFKKNTSTN